MLVQKHFPFLKTIHPCLLSESSVESTEPTENISLKKIRHSTANMFLWLSIIYNTSKPWFLSAYLYPCLHIHTCPSDSEVRSRRWVLNPAFLRKFTQKTDQFLVVSFLTLTSEFSPTGWRIRYMWEMISNWTMKIHSMPTEDFSVTKHISPATSMPRNVNVHTYGTSEWLHAPTTYGRNA